MIKLKEQFFAFTVLWFELGESLLFQQKPSLHICSNEQHHGFYSPFIILVLICYMLLTFNCLLFDALNVLRLSFRDFGKCHCSKYLVFVSGFQTHRIAARKEKQLET